MVHVADIPLVYYHFNVVLGKLFEQLVAFESEGLSIQSVVVVLSDFISDYREVLIVVNVLQNTANLVIRVNFTLLIESRGHIHRIEFARTVVREYIQKVTASTCQNGAVSLVRGSVVWVDQCNV